MLYHAGDRQPTHSKYLNQALKIICTSLVMLIALMSGFYISYAKKNQTKPFLTVFSVQFST